MAGADDSDGLAGWKMRQSFFEGAGEMEVGSFGSDSEDGFAEAENAVGGSFEGLGGGIVRIAGYDDLNWVMRKERGGQAVGGGEEAVLRSDAGKGFERFLGEGVVAVVAGEGVHSNERDGGDGIGARRRRILKWLAANVETAHGGSVGRTVEEAAALGVAVARDGEVYGLLRGSEIAGIERGFVSIEQRKNAENLVVE